MVERAMKAEADGDMALAGRLYDIGAGLGRAVPTKTQAVADRDERSTKQPYPAVPGLKVPVPVTKGNDSANCYKERQQSEVTKSSGTTTKVIDLICDESAVPTSVDVGLTPFFQKNLEELKGPLPLTIFNEEWQDKAIMHYSEKKPKAEESGSDRFRYSGYPYPSKYCQTYNEWSVNHQGFVSALGKIGTAAHATFAGWLVIHKRHCDAIIIRDGYMAGLRYDIQIRSNAFAHRVKLGDGRVSVANISVYREDVVRKAYGKARKFEEVDFPDNPYSAGGRRYGWDPTTGQPKSKGDSGANILPLHLRQPDTRPVDPKQPNQQRRTSPDAAKGQERNGNGGQKQGQGGYKGNRYNPRHGERDGGRDGGRDGNRRNF
ncbi:hypothetical protein PTTG_27686 [Puccinia triticina 1-1 BBBD Race 1]|uniref:Uncharacterized protein n=1 Tax=Puccinia triticina (isolate 1-1 / race 1 (BBBD)) TaxID=630390 RepID=A0A180GIY0_PUCT1|nr:hypothetical protein PTTG_27686 [Puccinia triticina 1-1 BBBD Race 1]